MCVAVVFYDKQIRAADAAKMVSQSWKELDETEKAKWLDMGRRDRERYEREKAAYRGPWKVPDIKYPNGPKKPMSAFLAFGNERRKKIAAANPALTGTEISSLLSRLWRECPAHVKQSYRDREAKEREQFKKDRAEWDRQKDQALVDAIMCSSEDNSVEETMRTTATTPTASTPVSSPSAASMIMTSETKKLSDEEELKHRLPRFVIPKDIFTMPPQSAYLDEYELMNNAGMTPNIKIFSTNHHPQEHTVAKARASFIAMERNHNAENSTSRPITLPVPPANIPADGLRTISEEVFEDSCFTSFWFSDNNIGSNNNFNHPLQVQQEQSSRFDHLSWDDILQNDELFEDFPASEVPDNSNSSDQILNTTKQNSPFFGNTCHSTSLWQC